MLEAIRDIALLARDPARTAALFHDLFDARAVALEDEEGHVETFVRLAGTWIVLVSAPVERVRTGGHFAFHATLETLEATATRLHAMARDSVRQLPRSAGVERLQQRCV